MFLLLLRYRCFWIIVAFASFWFVLFLSVLSLGFDICGNPESDPPQHIEQQQLAGKQFDHIKPQFFYQAYFYLRMYICIAILF